VQYAAPADLPDSFVIKLPAQDPAVRQRVALSYRSEHAFYTRVADTVAVPLPRCYHCTYTDSGDFALLLADMAPAQQGDQIRGCTAAEAHLAVTALAGLHGPRWCDPTWLSFDGTVMPKPDEATARGLGDITRLAATTTIDKVGDRLDPADRATVLEAADVIADWLLGAGERFSILHGDYRADNLLFQAGEVTVVDWQTLAVGLPARDLAYFIGTSLQPAERTHPRAGLSAGAVRLRGHRLRRRNLLAGLPFRDAADSTDHHARFCVLRRHRTRRRHGGDHAGAGQPRHPGPRHAGVGARGPVTQP
jgi:aminoglycoside phosphotransferase (APT) family kinase protein